MNKILYVFIFNNREDILGKKYEMKCLDLYFVLGNVPAKLLFLKVINSVRWQVSLHESCSVFLNEYRIHLNKQVLLQMESLTQGSL